MHKMKTWVISVEKIESLENQNNLGSHSGDSNMLLYQVKYYLQLLLQIIEREILATTTTKLSWKQDDQQLTLVQTQPVDNFDKVSPDRYCLVFQSLRSFRNIFIEYKLHVFCDEKMLMWLPPVMLVLLIVMMAL